MDDKIIITTGDPNGIGAEITIKALNQLDLPADKVVLISNEKIINFYGKLDKNYEIIEIPFAKDITPGNLCAECGEFAFESVKRACEIEGKAIVTAPVAKNALYLAGHNFSGQTEILQKYLAKENQFAEMLFVCGDYRVLLLTRHCALKDINITQDLVISKVKNLQKFFNEFFGIENPKFALCGLNPHAGEDGILGSEEEIILKPAVEILRGQNINITNPLPADTLFCNALKYDCVIANYHDQGLIPIKTLFGIKTVNMTIGLDKIRTSPGHGTAFDIAGQNIADYSGMVEAIKVAAKL